MKVDVTPPARLLLAVTLALPPSGLGGTAEAGPTKSVKECNKELDKQRDALEAAGDTPQAFFHRCWWSSKPGEPTPVLSAKSASGSASAAAKPAPQVDRKARVAIKRAAPRAFAPARPAARRFAMPPDGPPREPMFAGPPPLVLAERPPPPLYRPVPRVCVNLAPITAGIVRGRPCVPLLVGPGLDVP